MDKSYAIINLVRSLSASEKKRMIKWSKSNQKLPIKVILNALQKGKNKEEIWSELFPEIPFNPGDKKQDQSLRNLFHDFKKNLDEFFITLVLEKDIINRNLLLLEEYKQRKLDGPFKRLFRKTIKELEASKHKSSEWYRKRYKLLSLAAEHVISNGSKLKGIDFYEAIRMYDQSWILEMLMIEISRLDFNSRGERVKSNQSIGKKLDYFLSVIYLDHEYWDSPLISLFDDFRKIYLKDNANLSDLWEDFKKNNPIIDKKSSQMLFYVLLNACVIQVKKKGDIGISYLLLDLYKWGIESKLLLIDNIFHPHQYKNFITSCINLKKYGDAEFFMSKLKKLLPSDKQDNYYNFCKGFLRFKQGLYRDSIWILSQKYGNEHLEIQAKLITAQSWFELNDEFNLNRFLLSLKSFVNTQNFQKHEKEGYLNRIKMFIKLIKTTPGDFEKLELLRAEILSMKLINNPEWLLNKVKT